MRKLVDGILCSWWLSVWVKVWRKSEDIYSYVKKKSYIYCKKRWYLDLSCLYGKRFLSAFSRDRVSGHSLPHLVIAHHKVFQRWWEQHFYGWWWHATCRCNYFRSYGHNTVLKLQFQACYRGGHWRTWHFVCKMSLAVHAGACTCTSFKCFLLLCYF